MMNESKERLIKYSSWTILAVITAICSYFIVHNAAWILGDDAIVMGKAGWGHYFPMSRTIIPENGRFFPLTYFMYNFWAPLFGHKITATQLYSFHVIIFVLFIIMTYYLVLCILRNRNALFRYGVALLITLFMIGRHYPDFMNCYSTAWFGAFLNIASVLFGYLFYTKKRNLYGIIAFCVLAWATYCSEIAFIVPLAWGVAGLLLWEKSSKSEKIFHISLIADAVLFLVIYFFCIFLKAESFYSASHGVNVGLVENALKIILAQKFLWVVIALFVVRVWDVLKNKSDFTIFDVFILTAAAHCCGGFILKLNWVLYYNRAVVIALPAVIYYLDYYLKPYWTVVIMSVFACWYGLKIPKTINIVNQQRNDTVQFMEKVVGNMSGIENVYLYYPSVEHSCFDEIYRNWLYEAFETFLGYYTDIEDLKLEWIDQYSGKEGIYIVTEINEKLSKDGNRPVIEDCVHVAHNDMRDMDAYIKK